MESKLSLTDDHRYSNVLVVGFYNRGNLGDDAFSTVFSQCLPGCHIVCSDDLEEIPRDVTVILCGGGDIINSYFMDRIHKVLAGQSRRIPCYAVSVGIPYTANIGRYLDIFDFVVVRSDCDLQVARQAILENNVVRQPDLCSLLKPSHLEFRPVGRLAGVALARPLFARNPAEASLMEQTVQLVQWLAQEYDWVWLLPFNFGINPTENDVELSKQVQARVGLSRVYTLEGISDPADMLAHIDACDFVLGMRFHSIAFSMLRNRPFVALYTTRKIGNLLEQHQCLHCGIRMDVDEKDRPVRIDVEAVEQKMKDTSSNAGGFAIDFGTFDVSLLRQLVFLDGLSGVFNRRYFDQQIAIEWSRAARNDQPLSLILLDVDFFKLFNDR
jgi:GGDEF domain-containing protein